MNAPISLAEALPLEQQRVRELRDIYLSLGHVGSFGALMMAESLKRAELAAAHGDCVMMLQALNDLKGFKE